MKIVDQATGKEIPRAEGEPEETFREPPASRATATGHGDVSGDDPAGGSTTGKACKSNWEGGRTAALLLLPE